MLLILALAVPAPAQEAYVSPYWLKFTVPLESLTADFSQPPRGMVEEQSFEPPFARWNDPAAYSSGVTWGPKARPYPPPEIPAGVDATTWKRERLVAVARKYIGYEYQHHHVPDWQPPEDWPSQTPGRAKGLDCSNFTSWVYNYGLGMKFTSHVRKQADMDGLRVLQGPQDLATMRRTLVTGDLLFLRTRKGTRISHVVMWVGDLGQPADDPLVVDSHGGSVKDSRGVAIPRGIHLRPFREGSWYHESFDHALRLVR